MSISKILAALCFPIALAAIPACDEGTEPTPRDGDAAAGGKADAVDADDADASCPAASYVRHAVDDRTDHIFSNCHDESNGRFVARACCADDLELIEDISGCPAQVEFNDAAGSGKRCVNDVSGHPGQGQFVATACCAALCEDAAAFDANGQCRNSLGQFEETICCIRNDNLTANNCDGAEWEHVDGGARDFACRASNGRFTFDACCVDQCAEAISSTGQVPEGCSFDALAADECPADSAPNAAGICHDPDNGQFVKAACCELVGKTDGLHVDASDACWLGTQTKCE